MFVSQPPCRTHSAMATMLRLLQACLRERLLPFEIAKQQIIFQCLKQPCHIIITHASLTHLERLKTQANSTILLKTQHNNQALTDLNQLMTLIEKELSLEEQQNWQSLCDEINNHLLNDADITTVTEHYQQQLKKTLQHAGYPSLWQWLNEQYPHHQLPIFFEQWASLGHPTHPCNKTRLGFSSEELKRYSPEFKPHFGLLLGALKKTQSALHCYQPNDDYTDYFARYFPQHFEQWKQRLSTLKLEPTDYYPLPIHPWQYQHTLAKRFADYINADNLLVFKDIQIQSTPTLAVRSVITTGDPLAPQIKLPIAVQTTSALRTVSRASTQNSPQVAALLHKILQKNNHIKANLRLLASRFGLSINHLTDDESKHIGVIFRDNINCQVDHDETAVVVCALFEKTPLKQQALACEILQAANCHNTNDVQDYFRHYCDIVLQAFFDLYLCHGIALEGHQQNTLMIFKQHQPQAALIRDFGGVRIFQDKNLCQQYSLNVYPQSATFTDDWTEVRLKFIHTVLQMHLGNWPSMLADYCQTNETHFWEIIRQAVIAAFLRVKSQVDSERWQQEYEAILTQPWQLKSLLRMRLNKVYKNYIFTPIANPLNGNA